MGARYVDGYHHLNRVHNSEKKSKLQRQYYREDVQRDSWLHHELSAMNYVLPYIYDKRDQPLAMVCRYDLHRQQYLHSQVMKEM